MRTTHRRKAAFARLSPLIAALGCALGAQAQTLRPPTTFNVTNLTAAGPGSLYQALTDLNAPGCSGTDTIDIQGGPFVIGVPNPLPVITCGVTIRGNASTLNGAVMYGGGCGLEGAVPFKVENLTVQDFQSFSPQSAGICGPVTLRGSRIRRNDIGVRIENGSGYLGGVTNADRNYIFGNVVGVQVGSSGDALIRNNYVGIDASGLRVMNEVGIQLGGRASMVENNVISGNASSEGFGTGVQVDTPGSTVRNNLIGTDPSGASALGNETGILVFAPVTISGNVIAASNYGIDLWDAATVSGNRIGTNAAGNASLGNRWGVYVSSDASGTRIDGGNVISGNTDGIMLDYVSAVTVDGNLIGTQASGTAPLANDWGVSLECASNVDIVNNTISGNDMGGIWMSAYSSRIEGNRIGYGADGVTRVGNNNHGVIVDSIRCELPAAVTRKARSAAAAGGNRIAGNSIAYNGKPGIAVFTGVGNAIVGNSIHDNGSKEIDLLNDAVNPSMPRPNDAGDGDGGPNNGQNYPDIISVDRAGADTRITFTLDGPIGASFVVEAFANPSPARSGAIPAGTLGVTLESSPQTFVMTIAGTSLDHFTLTATTAGDLIAETSEFSAPVSATLTPAVSVSPASLDFGDLANGSSSAPRSVKLTSIGTAAWVPGRFTNGACSVGTPMCEGTAFICATSCKSDTRFVPGTSCQFTATFAPLGTAGPQSTRVSICDNAGSTQVIDLAGNAIAPPPIRIEPDRFDFGAVVVGRASAPQRFDVVNPSSDPVSIGPVGTQGAFELVSSNCGTTLAARSSCAADVRFLPTQPTDAIGAVFVPLPAGASQPARGYGPKAAPTGSAMAALYGRGIDSAQIETPAAVDLGAYTVGSPPIVRPIVVSNTGNAVVTLDAIRVSGPFALSHDCPFNFHPGTACTLTVRFSDATLGEASGAITIVSSASGGLRTIALRALVQRAALPVIIVNPVSVSFGNRIIGTQSATQRITIANDGGAPATLGPFTASLDFLVVRSTCAASLEPQATCFADIAMRPLGFGARAGDVSFSSNAAGSPHRVDLIGSGCRPFAIGNNRTGGAWNCSP